MTEEKLNEELQGNIAKPVLGVVKERRNRQYCKFWKLRGKKTSYCLIDKNDPLKQCHGVCKQFLKI